MVKNVHDSALYKLMEKIPHLAKLGFSLISAIAELFSSNELHGVLIWATLKVIHERYHLDVFAFGGPVNFCVISDVVNDARGGYHKECFTHRWL